MFVCLRIWVLVTHHQRGGRGGHHRQCPCRSNERMNPNPNHLNSTQPKTTGEENRYDCENRYELERQEAAEAWASLERSLID